MFVLASVLTELRIVNLLAETPSGRDKEDCLTNLELTSFYFFLYTLCIVQELNLQSSPKLTYILSIITYHGSPVFELAILTRHLNPGDHPESGLRKLSEELKHFKKRYLSLKREKWFLVIQALFTAKKTARAVDVFNCLFVFASFFYEPVFIVSLGSFKLGKAVTGSSRSKSNLQNDLFFIVCTDCKQAIGK